MTELHDHGSERSADSRSSVNRLIRYGVAIAVAWTVAVGGSVAWNLHQTSDHTRQLALADARANLNKDLAFRLWATSHGGVYVPIDESTPPNQHLGEVEERDIETPSGVRLTLMNPAYMLRQTMEHYSDLYGVRGKITSLKPLRPENAPDGWERVALNAFETGVGEISEFTAIDGVPFLRLIRPLPTEPGCLKCHGFQGYKEGDIRGAVGISVPLAPYSKSETRSIEALLVSHGLIWIMGLGLIGVGAQRGHRHLRGRIENAEALRRARDQLEVRVEERTRELEDEIAERKNAEAALRAAKEQADLANRTKTEFLANMSHELRTPLNSIIGFSEILKDELFGPVGKPEYREYAGDILQSGRHLLDLITDLLDVSRIEVGALSLEEREVELGRVVASCQRLVTGRAEMAGLRLEVKMAEPAPVLLADERRVKQILLNLLSNAVKFTPRGGSVTIEVGTGGGEGVTVVVTDTGIGIAPDDWATALSTFGQVDSSMARKYDGAGLGLPLSRKLMEMHGGTLDLESGPGAGTTVVVRFPAERLIRR